MAPAPSGEVLRRRWRANLRVTALLLAVWFAVSFGVTFYAREFGFSVFGWPLSFWVAAQGAPLVYLVLVCLYARRARRLDDEAGVAEDD